MANVKISDLITSAPATVVNNTDGFEINQGGTSKGATASLIRGTDPQTVDISAANLAVALSAATGSGERKRISWYGGDGSHTAQFTGQTIYAPDNTALTAGTGTGQLAGEGSGFMEVIDRVSNRWELAGYDDYFSPAISGNWTVNNWTKHLNGKVTFNGKASIASVAMTVNSGSWFRSNTVTEAWPLALASIDNEAGLQITSASANAPTIQIDAGSTDTTNLAFQGWRGDSDTLTVIFSVTLTGANWY